MVLPNLSRPLIVRSATLLTPNAPLKLISEHLGHPSAAITGDIYSHVLPGMQADALRALEAQIFSTPGLHQTCVVATREAEKAKSRIPSLLSSA